MSDFIFDKARESFLKGEIAVATGTVKAYLVRGYTPVQASHQYLSDVTGNGGTLVSSFTLANKTTAAGVLGADNGVFAAVATGAQCDRVLLVLDTGTASTSRLIANIDSMAGLPVTPNGGDINCAWSTGANKILKL